MGVVTNVTRSIFLTDVLFVILKTLIVQDAVTAMAFIAEGINGAAFTSVIGGHIWSFEDRGKCRAMRAVGASAASLGSGAVVVTVAAGNEAGSGQRCDEAWYIRVPSRSYHRVERGITCVELQTDVSLGELPSSQRHRFVEAVAMTAKADLVFKGGDDDLGPRNTYSSDTGQRS